MNELHTKDNKPPDLANRVKYDTIKDVLKREIATLTDRQAEYVLKQLQQMLQNQK